MGERTARREVSVVIPVYKGLRSVPELVDRLEETCRRDEIDVEIVLVNDGSPDASWEMICALAARYENIVAVDLMRNYGQHSAVFARGVHEEDHRYDG